MTVAPPSDDLQAAAIAAPLAESLSLVGPPGTGKTTALVLRALRLAATLENPGQRILLLAPSDAGVARLALRQAQDDNRQAQDDNRQAQDDNRQAQDDNRQAQGDNRQAQDDMGDRQNLVTLSLSKGQRDGTRIECTSFGDLAFALLRDARKLNGRSDEIERIDDVRASLLFERAGAKLFALEWTEFDNELDPEITGLRAPERFSAAAFRLIRKLRGSLTSPEEFLRSCLRGANQFYGHPPNFASADIILDTKAEYRDSLLASPNELQRQGTREVDLAKILARLYASYVETLVANGVMTPTDAVYEAAILLRDRADVRELARARYAAALVDDAQDLTGAQLALLAGIFGDGLRGVTLAGDPEQATRGFATGARGSESFRRAATSISLATRHRCAPAIERVARSALHSSAPPPEFSSADAEASPDAVALYRADSVRDEARYVAAEIAVLLRAGTPPGGIAVIVRSLGCAQPFVDALLARDVPVDVAGAASLYEYRAILDALAALWSAVDPFRHDFLLRALEAPWMRLSDASVAVLCADAAEPQPLLFELPDDPPEPGDRRWDRRRSLRLGRNVTRGDVDADLPAAARERLVAFRAARSRWEAAARTLDMSAQARLVLDESVLATLEPGARGRFDGHLVARLLDEIDAFADRAPLATLDDFLSFAERVANAEADLLSIAPRDGAAVRVLDVEAAKGEEFDAVFVPGARAGAWPRYYVPDAFLYAPSYGMIPKENVGDADTARTAKFTYTLSRLKLREKYVAEERRAFYCAATRARRRLFVSAPGRATRGIAAPEILEELQREQPYPD